jgi:hypothetical protein
MISSCSDNPYLAEFKGGNINQNEYINHFLLSTKYKPDVMPSEENLKEIVSLLCLKKMAILEAKDQGISGTEEFKEQMAVTKRKHLSQVYHQNEFINAVITDSLIKKFYDNYTPQYRMAYIMRPFVESSTKSFIQSQKDTIEYVYKLLLSGQKFTDLAKKYSQDITSNQKGGDIGFVIRESLGDDKLRSVMDSLEQFTYSRPFKGYGGFYIMYKGEKRDVEVPPFKDIEVRIWQTLNRIRGHKIKELVDKRIAMLKKRYHYQIDEKVVEEIRKAASGGGANRQKKPFDFERLSEKDMNKTVATFDQGSIKVSELFENPKRAPINMTEFAKRLDLQAKEYLYSKHAMELGYDRTEKVKDQLHDMKNTLLQILISKKEIKDKAQAELDSLKEENKNNGSDIKKINFQQKYFEFEKEFKSKFENKLKEKYAFKYIPQNFEQALNEATVKKEEQNAEQEKKEQ